MIPPENIPKNSLWGGQGRPCHLPCFQSESEQSPGTAVQDEFLGTFTPPLPPLQPPKAEPPGQRATSKAGFSSLSEGSGRAGVGMRLCPVPCARAGAGDGWSRQKPPWPRGCRWHRGSRARERPRAPHGAPQQAEPCSPLFIPFSHCVGDVASPPAPGPLSICFLSLENYVELSGPNAVF